MGVVVQEPEEPFWKRLAKMFFFQVFLAKKKAVMRPPGVEPGPRAWKALIIPLDHGRGKVAIYLWRSESF